MSQMYSDAPYTLGNPEEQKRIKKLDFEAHQIQPLLPLVDKIRKGQQNEVPLPDPLDGGTNAKFLFLLRSPGREAKHSGFISMNNPDPTAKNTFKFLHEAGFKRKDILLWNIVPWYLGKEAKNVNRETILVGAKYADDLVKLIPNLRALVFMGLDSKKAIPQFEKYLKGPKQIISYFTFLPSTLGAFGGLEPKAGEILDNLKKIHADFL